MLCIGTSIITKVIGYNDIKNIIIEEIDKNEMAKRSIKIRQLSDTVYNGYIRDMEDQSIQIEQQAIISWPMKVQGVHNIITIEEMEKLIDIPSNFVNKMTMELIGSVLNAMIGIVGMDIYGICNSFNTIPELLIFCKEYINFRNDAIYNTSVDRFMENYR